jgi:hypothetical protein
MNQSNILLSIASTGFVGIGTTLPAYKLDVNGNLQATEVVTNTISAKGTNQSVAINPTGTGKVVIGGESIVVARLTSEPASGSTGQIYFDRSIGRFKGYNGSTWMIFSEILPFVPTLLDNYSSANLDNGSTLNGSVKKVGQSFNAGAGGSLDSAEWYLQKTGSPTGSIYAKIYAHSGTYGSSSVPTGSPLAISDSYDISTIPTTDTTIRFNFSGVNRITLSGSTNYVVTIEYTGDSSNYVRVGADFSSPTHAGNYSESLDGSSWTAFSVDDNIFAVYASQ